MRKIFILMPVVFSLILGGCSIDWKDEKTAKISELEKQIIEFKKVIDDDIFRKKQECVGYKNEMLKFAKNYHSEIYELEEVFYSPVKKSCYFIAKEGVGSRLLFDYLSQSYVHGYSDSISCHNSFDGNIKDACIDKLEKDQEEYRKILQVLKGE